MSQISEIEKAIADRYRKFRDKQEIHLSDKEFKEFEDELFTKFSPIGEIKFDNGNSITYSTGEGRAIIKNRDATPNFAEREMY